MFKNVINRGVGISERGFMKEIKFLQVIQSIMFNEISERNGKIFKRSRYENVFLELYININNLR